MNKVELLKKVFETAENREELSTHYSDWYDGDSDDVKDDFDYALSFENWVEDFVFCTEEYYVNPELEKVLESGDISFKSYSIDTDFHCELDIILLKETIMAWRFIGM